MRAAWWTLGHAAGLTALAIMSYARHHGRGDARGTVQREAGLILAAAGDLAVKGMATYGTEDPFPGRWRSLPTPSAPGEKQ